MAKIADEPVLVLHTRPYRNTSLIVDLLTAHHGRLSAVYRSARGGKQGNRVQPFAQFLAGWYGRGQMVTLTGVDNLQAHWLSGNRSASAYYVVELLARLLREREPVPQTFLAACVCIHELAQGVAPMQVLRPFEAQLLQDLGVALDFAHDADSGAPIDPERSYELEPQHGFISRDIAASTSAGQRTQRLVVSGAVLRAIDRGDYRQAEVCVAAKHIFHRCFEPLLDGRELVSRRLYLGHDDSGNISHEQNAE